MQAYETGLKGGESRIVMSPKSDFFRYFTTPTPTETPTGDADAGNPDGEVACALFSATSAALRFSRTCARLALPEVRPTVGSPRRVQSRSRGVVKRS